MNVLIAGATGGLGEAVVDLFRKQGANVFEVARSGEGVIRADLTKPEEAQRAAAEAGVVDAVVHLTGAFAAGSENDAWHQMLSVNLESAVYLFNAVLPGMKQRGHGVLIAVGSKVAVEPAAGLAAYGASKAALVHYVKTLALELKDAGVRANAVLPSTIDTAANRRAMPQADFSKWVQPHSLAGLIAWLASDAAADVSGAVIPVYGRS